MVSEDRSSYEWGILWMLLSATFLSISFLFLKINLFHFNYFFLLFLRFCIPLLLVILLLIFRWEWKALCSFPTPFYIHIFRWICVLVAQYGIAFYISKSSLLNATVLMNSAPLFIPLIEWIFQKQRPGKSTIISALIAFLGVILILRPDRSLFTMLSGVGVLAALGQAGSQILYGLKPKSENPLNSLFYLFLGTSAVSCLVFIWQEKASATPFSSRFNWVMVLAVVLMGLATLLNQYYRGLAYKCSRPSTLATFLYFSAFVSVFFDYIVFKQFPHSLTIIGTILIILGGVLKIFLRARVLKKKTKNKL